MRGRTAHTQPCSRKNKKRRGPGAGGRVGGPSVRAMTPLPPPTPPIPRRDRPPFGALGALGALGSISLNQCAFQKK
jgi:hypothetical protein